MRSEKNKSTLTIFTLLIALVSLGLSVWNITQPNFISGLSSNDIDQIVNRRMAQIIQNARVQTDAQNIKARLSILKNSIQAESEITDEQRKAADNIQQDINTFYSQLDSKQQSQLNDLQNDVNQLASSLSQGISQADQKIDTMIGKLNGFLSQQKI